MAVEALFGALTEETELPLLDELLDELPDELDDECEDPVLADPLVTQS